MIITKDYARKEIEKIAPIVEEISGLKCNLEDHKIINGKSFILPKTVQMGYNAKLKEFHIKRNFTKGNRDLFKLILGHEVAHNAQYSTFPDLLERKNPEVLEYKPRDSPITKKIKNPLRILIEADAKLIERELNEKYFKKPKINFLGLPLIPRDDLLFIGDNYMLWSEVLKMKYKGEREKINSLYNSSFDELIDLFGSWEIKDN